LKEPAAFIVTLQLSKRREKVLPKHGYISAKLHEIIFQKTALFIITATFQVNLNLNLSITLLNPLVPELCALFTLPITLHVLGQQLHLVLSASHRALTEVDFSHQRVKDYGVKSTYTQ